MKDYKLAIEKLKKLNYQSFTLARGEETVNFKTQIDRLSTKMGREAALVQMAIYQVGRDNFWAFICDQLETAELGIEG